VPAAYVPAGQIAGQEEAGGLLDFPASQSTQAVPSACKEAVVASSAMNFPEGQLMQLAEAAGEYSPEEQTLHDAARMGTSAFFPASQSMQAARLAWREAVIASSTMCFPKGQLVQVGEAVEENAPEEQTLQVVLPCSENFPASQSSQMSSETPLEALYFPATQEVHTEAPPGENFPITQSRQSDSES